MAFVQQDEYAVVVNNLSKVYSLYNSSFDRLKEAISPFRKRYHHDFLALDNISFGINRGESIGIIGKNGSGKSTLLKILTGILIPTSGSVVVNGKISALLELGAGFNPELTGIENVYFNGMLMGYSREEMDKRLDGIFSFADIGNYIYQPVKTYSSGMFVRLAFALAINVDPDILIVDEALSVGDIFFQQKCYSIIRSKIDEGVTSIFVSHDLEAIRNLCTRGMLLSAGKVVYDGLTEEATSLYLAHPSRKISTSNEDTTAHYPTSSRICSELVTEIERCSILTEQTLHHGVGRARIVAATVADIHGNINMSIPMLSPVHIQVAVEALRPIVELSCGIHLYDRIGNLIFATSTKQLGVSLPSLQSREMVTVRLCLTLNIQPGEYTFSLGVEGSPGDGSGSRSLQDRCENLGPLTVLAGDADTPPFYGIVQLPCKIDFEIVGENRL